jgi:dCTP deaminase
MALLSKQSLVAALHREDLEERLVVMPMLDEPQQVGAASIDVRLGTTFRLLRRTVDSGIDPRNAPQAALERGQEEVVVAFGQPLWLHPGQFVLGATLEYLRFPSDLGGYVIGRSSLGRVGLLVATAVMIQPGFAGNLTLELVNHGEGPIALYAGSRVAQLAVHSLDEPTQEPYGGKYIGPTGPEVSKLAGERSEVQELGDVAARLAGRGG